MKSSAVIIDGKMEAERITESVRIEVEALSRKGIVPGLAVILLGEDPASTIYVRSKLRKTAAIGMRSSSYLLSAETSQSKLLALIAALNADPGVHGILIQLPLPAHINRNDVLDAIDPTKDLDGFYIVNAGKLAVGRDDGLAPCTPLGCLILLKQFLPVLAGAHAVVIGCPNIVGRPMARLLLNEGCTVVITHLQTQDVAAEARRADILIVAAGHPGLIRGNWVKPGAIVIDVGINRVSDGEKTKIVGDAAFSEIVGHAGAITPVPGGVGPMTIACLLQNTVRACQRAN